MYSVRGTINSKPRNRSSFHILPLACRRTSVYLGGAQRKAWHEKISLFSCFVPLRARQYMLSVFGRLTPQGAE